jgi:hypothetical protein
MPMRYCGREFSEEELTQIRARICEQPQRTRLDISRLVCRTLHWYKPDGGLKEMSCRVALLRMQRDGLIRLPPPLTKNGNGKVHLRRSPAAEPKPPMLMDVATFQELRVEVVSGGKESALWNEYISRYHYLGYTPLPGAQLRYVVRFQAEKLALLGFGASAWKVAPRDRFIGWTAEQRKRNLHLVVNNARFLILPWVHAKNLASKILSLVIKRLPEDWQKRYGYRPVLLESFVECGRFLGTSYKAGNWIPVGLTQGRGKLDVKNEYALPKKSIWLYPLTKDFRQVLCC